MSEEAQFGRLLLRPAQVVLSFEFLVAALIFVTLFKASPRFAWLFPVDGTLLAFGLTALVGGIALLRLGVYWPAAISMSFYVMFVAWMLASLLWTTTYDGPLVPFLGRVLLVNGLVMLCTIGIIARSRARTLRFLAAGTLLALVIGIDYMLAAGSLSWRGRLEGANYGDIARLVGIGFVTCLAFLIYARVGSLHWVVLAACAGLMFVAILMIGSRQTFLALVVQILVILLMVVSLWRGAVRVPKGVLPMLVLVGGAFVAVALMLQSGSELWTLRRLNRLIAFVGGNADADASASRRIEYLVAAATYWSQSWSTIFFGNGLFSFSEMFYGRQVPGAHPHNLVMALLTEFGIVGLVLFVLFVGSIIAQTWPQIRVGSPLATVLVALLVGTAIRAALSADIEGSFIPLVYLTLLGALRAPASRRPAVPEPAAATADPPQLGIGGRSPA